MLETKKLIKTFYKFFEANMLKDIKKAYNEGLGYLELDLELLDQFDYNIVEEIMLNPEEYLSIMTETLKQFKENSKQLSLKIMLINIPKTQRIRLREIRHKHAGKLYSFKGLIRKKTDVVPKITHLKYLCTNPSCVYSDKALRIAQLDEKLTEIKQCPKCKNGVDLVKKIKKDTQVMILEESNADLDSTHSQPKTKKIILEGKLTDLNFDEKINAGSKVELVGIIKENKKYIQHKESLYSEVVIEVNNIKPDLDELDDLKITIDDIKRWEDLTKEQDFNKRLVDSFATKIMGYDKIKEALLLQCLGGSKVKGERDFIHIFLIGDPSTAKTQMMKEALKIPIRSNFTNGKGSSGVGLTASTIKDELSGDYTLQAGALPMAHTGLCGIDEMDKMDLADTSNMHEAMESGTITVHKANIHSTLQCHTAVLGGANPKLGRFDPHTDIHKQIKFPQSLLTRFDLIFVMRDIPDKNKDRLIAKHIINKYKKTESKEVLMDLVELRKFIAYAKTKNPIISQEADDLLVEYYVEVRNRYKDDESSDPDIVARQLEGIVRLSQAYAKLRLNDIVEKEDMINAIELNKYYLESHQKDTNSINITKIENKVPKKDREFYTVIEDVIRDLRKENQPTITENIYEKMKKFNIEENVVDEYLEKMREFPLNLLIKERGKYWRIVGE